MLAFAQKTSPSRPTLTDQQPNPDFRREAEPGIPWSRVSGFAILYAVSAWLSFVLSEDRRTEATFWLPIGMTMGALMISPRAHWRYYLGGMLVGDLAFNWINGIWPWPHWFAVAAANVATVLTPVPPSYVKAPVCNA